MNEATKNFLALMDEMLLMLEDAKSSGREIDWSGEPYTDEQLREMSLLGMKLHAIGETLMQTSAGIAEILADEVQENRGIDLREDLENGAS